MLTSTAIAAAQLQRGQLTLIVHPHPTLQGRLLALAAELAARQTPAMPVLVLDGGNCFNLYPVARLLRSYGEAADQALQRLWVGRAFTCFEMASLLRQAAGAALSGAAYAALALDFLSTFRDENIPLGERRRLLRSCLPDLRLLAQHTCLLVSARPADPELMQILRQAAERVLELELPSPPPAQLSFWNA